MTARYTYATTLAYSTGGVPETDEVEVEVSWRLKTGRNVFPRGTPLADRLFGRVTAADALGCWDWQGSVLPTGYGCIRDGRKSLYTHRLAYELAYGEKIPAGSHTDHLCRNRRCCNPAHLEIVTPRENTLRGAGPVTGNHQGLWTHCKRGHPFSAENTIDNSGRRGCRACVNAGKRLRRAARDLALQRAPDEVEDLKLLSIDGVGGPFDQHDEAAILQAVAQNHTEAMLEEANDREAYWADDAADYRREAAQ